MTCRHTTASLLTAAGLALAMTAMPAHAIDLTGSIGNADANDTNPVDGQDTYSPTNVNPGWKSWNSADNGGNVRLWNPSSIDRSSTANNQFFDYGWGGLDGEGSATGAVIAVRTQSFDYANYSGTTGPWDSFGNRLWNVSENVYADGKVGDGDPTAPHPTTASPVLYSFRELDGGTWDGSSWSGGTRDFEAAAQVISVAFDPTAKYILTVEVGRLAEGTGPNYDGSSLNAGDRIDPVDGVTVLGTSTRFANDAPATWGGYEVALMAGGAEGQVSSFGGWVTGTTDNPADADYIGMLASDSVQQAGLAQDSWGTSTVTYLPGSVDTTGLVGDNLVIRLAALETANHQETQTAAFDNVRLTKVVAGDCEGGANDFDDDVDSDDLNELLFNYGGLGKVWEDGDFSGDGTVGSDDLNLLLFNYGFTPAASLEGAGDLVPEPGSLALLGLGGLFLARRRR